MKAIMVMFDSLNRHFLPTYGCDWIHAPNFTRLEKHATVYDNHYVGSLPCIPARRELHTGRYNFLHRSWGPLEPFDDSMPEILKRNNVYTHITTDHIHYFEEGGCTYHERYNSWEVSRGQEGDPFKGDVKGYREGIAGKPYYKYAVQDYFNRRLMCREEEMPQAVTFGRGIEFIEHNYREDDWFLTIETFDPHEPFYVPQKYKELYPELPDYGVDWPEWDCVPAEGWKARLSYAALISMCDVWLGRLLDCLDQYGLWEDTMVILCTDHGYLLGEHGQVGKVHMPGYRQVCNTPLYIWDPRNRKTGRSKRLTQTIDIPATILDFFGIERPKDMEGIPIREDSPAREGALFGVHGLYTCCTDGRWIYMRGANPEKPVYNYTLMPTHMHDFFSDSELKAATLEEALPFSKGLPVLKCRTGGWSGNRVPETDYLFDLVEDGNQDRNLAAGMGVEDTIQERRMQELMFRLMKQNDAPKEYFERLGFRL